MRVVLIADTFPPLRTSGAVQLRDLSREFVRQGHQLTVMLPCAELKGAWSIDDMDGVQVLRLKAPRTKDINYFSRTLGEFLMPFAMRLNLRKSPLANVKWDGVIWYAPSIFHGPLANALKQASECKGYLIIRDIFPEWAVDMGLMGRGLPYRFFDAVARYQYAVADTIGVQTPGNLAYFSEWSKAEGRSLEVLQNWLGEATNLRCSIRIDDTPLAGRKVFVYAGNMGVAQGMDILLQLAERLRHRPDVGFLFVGRGSDAKRLAAAASSRGLDNVLFRDEIHPDEIPDLYAQCHVGMVALDPRHKSHNIPGKFLTYMQSGLPVLANINAGNDLAEIIRTEQVGAVSEDNSVETLHRLADGLLTNLARNAETTMRCKSLFARQFSAEIAVKQVIRGLLDAPVTKEQEGRRMEVQVFSAEYLDSLTEQASASARLRQHRNVHADYADPVQRLFNAIEADSYIRPHRHGIAPRAEMMIAVRGQMALIVFSDDGEVVQTVRFGVERAHRPVPVGVEIPPGKWHTVLALQPGSVLLEVKAGPFEPAQPKEFAGWAPEEGSAAAKDYHQYLRSYCSEAGEGVGTRSDSIVDPHFEAVTTG